MYNKKSLFIIGLFCSIFVFVVYVAVTARKNQRDSSEGTGASSVERSFFREVNYFKLENLSPSIQLRAKTLEITNNNLLDFVKPRGIFFSDDSQVNYNADSGFMNQSTKLLKLNKNVHLSDETSDYVSDKLTYDGKRKIIKAHGHVSSQTINKKTSDIIKIKANKLISYMNKELSILEGSVKGRIIRKRRYESGMRFSSEIAELNSLKSRLDLAKSVKIYRNDYYLQSERAEIFLENYNKKLKYYVLYDDVKLEEKLLQESGEIQIRRAYAEKLEGHQRTQKIVLTGAPRVEQGRDTIKGYQITLRESVELIEVDDAQSSFSIKKDK